MANMVCKECGVKAVLMAAWEGKVVCFTCLLKNHPALAAMAVKYLTPGGRAR